jgi:hypothetical protein
LNACFKKYGIAAETPILMLSLKCLKLLENPEKRKSWNL